MEKFVIVDGNSLIHRAFYGLPMLKSLSGEPCNAVYGFLNMILNVISREQPKYFVCVFDAGKHTFRHDIYADYKGGRDHMPEDLATQLPMLKTILTAMGIKMIEIPEIEADDIIGSLTRKFDNEFILISGDKDLLQLVNENTTVWLTQKGISNVLKVDIPTLKSEFDIEPYQVIEMKSIMGDTSDNIPGVPGIGKVGASELIAEYTTLDNIFKNIDSVPNKYRQKLINNRELAYLSHTLATIKLDVSLDCKLEDCKYKLPFNEETYNLLKNLDFKSVLNRKELFVKPTEKLTETNLNAKIIEIDSTGSFEKMIQDITESGSFAINSENLSFNFATHDNEYILYKSGDIFNKNIGVLKELFESELQKVCFDAKALMHELRLYDISLNNYFDVSIAIYIANEMDAEINLDDALNMNGVITSAKAVALYKLKENYINKLINGLQFKLFSDIELPLVEVLFNMECNGIKIDVEEIKKLSVSYHEELTTITARIYSLAGEEFNINSPKQLQNILFNKLNIQYKGKLSTSIEVLNAIMDEHPIVKEVVRYRKVSKLISTYIDGMLNYVSDNDMIHTTFMQRTTSTGRLSSREPNLQNLPIRDDEGKALRKMFMSSFDDGKLVSADYNQIELRLIANFSGDENMIADYKSGKDIHTATASKIFNVPINEADSGMRRVAKSVNFGIIYGISGFGLSQNLGISQREANDFIKKYLSIYPKVKEYGDNSIVFARKKGYVSTMMGRLRHIPDINSTNHTIRGFAERIAKNMPLQGSASDIIKIAMIRVYNRIKNEGLKSKLILQIHDELIVDCPKSELDSVKRILKEEMESVVSLEVPLIVEVSEGRTLYDAK